MKYPYRTRFAKDIVTEFFPSDIAHSRKVIILCVGMPSSPMKTELLRFWAKKGYWVFFPRYRGTWESDGHFLEESPHQDILDIIDALPNGFVTAFGGERFQLEPTEIFLFGCSFGGPAALLCARDPRVTKVVAISSVVDWTAPSQDEPLDEFEQVVKEGFGQAFRFSHENWERLEKGEIYNPIAHREEIPGEKVMMIHAQDDTVVMPEPVQSFAEHIGANLIMKRRGGHLSSSITKEFLTYLRIQMFLKS